jgi:hypothetical protein
LAQISALPRLVCKFSQLLPDAALGSIAATLSANSIALPRWAAASLKAERRRAWSPAFAHHSTAGAASPACVLLDAWGIPRARRLALRASVAA